MTATAPSQTPTGSTRPGRAPLRRTRRVPRWGAAACFGGALLVMGLLDLVLDSNLVLYVLGTALLGTALFYGLSHALEGRRTATDRLVTCVVVGAFALAMIPLVSLAYEVVRRGAERFDGQFFTWSLLGVVGEGGGAYHAIMGTLVITGLATLISVPIGLFTAIYLVEYGTGRLKRAITLLVDVMTGIPSIVAGLFAYALFVLFFGEGIRFGFGGAVALSLLMIPIVVRSAEEMLRLVPHDLREASYALGVPKWRTIVKVVIPTALGGIVTGVTLAVARVAGETAPLLIIAGSTDSLNRNLFDERMMTLPVFIYYSYTQPGVPAEFGQQRAWGAALVLIAIVMALNLVARAVGRRYAPKTSR